MARVPDVVAPGCARVSIRNEPTLAPDTDTDGTVVLVWRILRDLRDFHHSGRTPQVAASWNVRRARADDFILPPCRAVGPCAIRSAIASDL